MVFAISSYCCIKFSSRWVRKFSSRCVLTHRFYGVARFSDRHSTYSPIDIIYEDKQIIVVNKQAGELCQGDQSAARNILDDLKNHIKIRDKKPGNVYLSMVHRLDRGTSGVLIFAKTSKSKSRLDKQFRDRTINKKYLCVVEGTFESMDGVCHDKISYTNVFGTAGGISSIAGIHQPFPSQNISVSTEELKVKSVEARLHYNVLGSFEYITKSHKESLSIPCSILDVTLETGRKHQIRVQFKNLGRSILGDFKYGSRHAFASNGIALHSYSLEIFHPVTGVKMIFTRKPQVEWNAILGKQYEDILNTTVFKHP